MDPLVKLIALICVSEVIYAMKGPDLTRKESISDESLHKVPSLSHLTSIRDESKYLHLYGPEPQEDLKCDYETFTTNKAEADASCAEECRNIAFITFDAIERYGDYMAVQQLYNQCHGFVAGDCRLLMNGKQWTWCQCQAFDFYRPARVCRLLIAAARITSNIGVSWRDYRAWHADYRKRLEAERAWGRPGTPQKTNSKFLATVKSLKIKRPTFKMKTLSKSKISKSQSESKKVREAVWDKDSDTP